MISRSKGECCLRAGLAVLICVCTVPSIAAQPPQTEVPDRSLLPYGTYSFGKLESIDQATGTLGISIPLGSLPRGRAGSGFELRLNYTSALYDTALSFEGGKVTTRLNPSTLGGWHYNYEYQLLYDYRTNTGPNGTPCNAPDGIAYKVHRLRIVFPDGSIHTLHPNLKPTGNSEYYTDAQGDGFYQVSPDLSVVTACGANSQAADSPVGTPLVYYTTDGTYARLEFHPVFYPVFPNNLIPWTQRSWGLYLADGSRVAGQGQFSYMFLDRNNNSVQVLKTLYQGSRPAIVIGDQSGRSLVIETGSYNYTPGVAADAIRAKGVGGAETVTYVRWQPISSGNNSYKCKPPGEPDPSVLTCGIGPNGTVQNVVQSIALPQAQIGPDQFPYYFSYHTGNGKWGELASVTAPNGYRVDYGYKFTGVSRDDLARLMDNPVVSKTATYLDENNGQSTLRSDTWSWTHVPGTRTEIAPDSGQTIYRFTDPRPYAGPILVDQIEYPNGDRLNRLWRFNRPFPRPSPNGNFDNSFVRAEYLTLASTKTRARLEQRDKNGNIWRSEDTDYFSYSPTYLGTDPTCALPTCKILRYQQTTYYVNAQDSAGTGADAGGYWNALPSVQPFRATLTSPTMIDIGGDGGNGRRRLLSYKPNLSGETAGTTANVKYDTTCKLDSTGCETTEMDYDSYGNVTSITRPSGVKTEFTYTAFDGPETQSLYPTTRTDGAGSATPRSFDFTYDKWTGVVKTEKDNQNNILVSRTFDMYNRPTVTTEAGGVSGQSGYLVRSSKRDYLDTSRYIVDFRDRQANGDYALRTISRFDMEGGVRWRQANGDNAVANGSDPNSGVKTDYRRMWNSPSGRYELESTPFSTQGEATFGWQRRWIDTSGRLKEVEYFAGQPLPPPFAGGGTANTQSTGKRVISYSANVQTHTDEAGKSSTYRYDGIGRLVEASQAGGSAVDYSYDSQSNLTSVTQRSQSATGLFVQKRVFEYDHFGRLVKSWMPETSPKMPYDPSYAGEPTNKPTSYEYFSGGNLKKKTDPRGRTVDFQYDGLDRLRFKIYSDGTPTVEYLYNSGGRVETVSAAGVSSTTFQYDSLGRVAQSTQTTNGISFPFGTSLSNPGYSWNLADGLVQMKYPSGRVVSWGVNEANRPMWAGTAGSYAYGATYTAAGQLAGMTLGSGVVEARTYNSRGQLVSLSAKQNQTTLFDLANEYSATANNGNLTAQTTLPLNVRQSYEYDSRNRLWKANEANEANWKQEFGYDEFGNRWVVNQSATIPVTGLTANGESWFQMPGASGSLVVNNRIKDESYDAAGNQLSLGGVTGDYDAEGRLRSVTGVNGTTTYEYDGYGRRVRRTVTGGPTTTFVYDANGQMAAEYLGGYTGTLAPQYLTQDQLGSTRLVTTAGGGVVKRADFLPFGQEIPVGVGGRSLPGYGQEGVRQLFTGKERDAETGLDYFGARYMASAQGRFTSPDPLLSSGRPDNPQSWNRYAYVLNNPLRFVDPTGLFEWDASFGGTCSDKALSSGGCSGFTKQQGKDIVGDRKAFRSQLENLNKSKDASLRADAGAIGAENANNGVTVIRDSKLPSNVSAQVSFMVPLSLDANGNPKLDLHVRTGATANSLFLDLAHEGSHIWDAQAVAHGNRGPMLHVQTELSAYLETVRAAQALGMPNVGPTGGVPFWNSSWSQVDQQTRPPQEIFKFLLSSPNYGPKNFKTAYTK